MREAEHNALESNRITDKYKLTTFRVNNSASLTCEENLVGN